MPRGISYASLLAGLLLLRSPHPAANAPVAAAGVVIGGTGTGNDDNKQDSGGGDTDYGGSPLSDLSRRFGYDPRPHPDSVVLSPDGTARFTVLSPRVVRCEYSSVGTFEDRATLAIVNRRRSGGGGGGGPSGVGVGVVPRPFSHSIVDVERASYEGDEDGDDGDGSGSGEKELQIRTGELTLTYRLNHTFDSRSLRARSTTPGPSSGPTWSWHYGDEDDGNLLGTIRSLDDLCTVSLNCTENANVTIHDEDLHCAWGLVSRGGWTTLDDTHNYLMGGEGEGPGDEGVEWFGNDLRSRSDVDVYLFGHGGSNFREALGDYTNLAGRVPMTRRSLLGSWYTRWFDFDGADVEAVVGDFRNAGMPLDVLVLDMNWHTKHAWTGYTWDGELFPFPRDSPIGLARNLGLITAANLHDAQGVNPWEAKFEDMCEIMGRDDCRGADNSTKRKAVPFQPLNATYMRSLDDVVLADLGFDFYWIDWQQGGRVGGIESGRRLNPTIITNHLRGTRHMRHGRNLRDQILARWGGLGSHRYPVGFSGDVSELSWECMAFQPYFGATAANVAYGSVSHDLVGPADDHELHVRWVQYVAHSGVMRMHDRGLSAGADCQRGGGGDSSSCAIVDPWRLPFEYLDPIREAMNARLDLLPYIYTETRKAYDTGLAMVRPMYYDWPDEEGAYVLSPDGGRAQYNLGDDVLVAPVTVPADPRTGLATRDVWVPPGVWYDDIYDELLRGPGNVTRKYALGDVPKLVRAGAVIPRLRRRRERLGVAALQYGELDYFVYPGASGGGYSLYEDDGETVDYILPEGGFARTDVSFVRSRGGVSRIDVTIGAARGSFAGRLTTRAVRIVLVGSLPILSAKVSPSTSVGDVEGGGDMGGVDISYGRHGGPGTFGYDGMRAEATVDLGTISTLATTNVSIQLASEAAPTTSSSPRHDRPHLETRRVKLYGERSRLAKGLLDQYRATPGSATTESVVGRGELKRAASSGTSLSHLADPSKSSEFDAWLSGYSDQIDRAIAELGCRGGGGTPKSEEGGAGNALELVLGKEDKMPPGKQNTERRRASSSSALNEVKVMALAILQSTRE